MRRREKEIERQSDIEEVIRAAAVCRLAMTDGRTPYVVPLCFGYDGRCLYFHSAPQGKKIELLKRNPAVCFEFDLDCRVIPHGEPCKWGMRYRSVIGYGRAVFIESPEPKRSALAVILRQYGAADAEIPDAVLDRTAVIRVVIDRMTGKASD